MCAFLPKADVRGANSDVRYRPIGSPLHYQRLPQLPPQPHRDPPPRTSLIVNNNNSAPMVADRRQNADAEVDVELRKQPTAEKGADDTDDGVTDDPKTSALHNLAGQ
jgi:hypothetical protein